MRNAYAVLGLAWIITIAAGVYAFNHSFARSSNTASEGITNSTISMASSTLTLRSIAFEDNGSLPSRFTCDGDQLSPTLSISGVPEGAKSLALIMSDVDVPKTLKPDGVFDHWVLFNIPSDTVEIKEAASAGTVGANGAGTSAYRGPCPPPQYEPSEHRYIFKLYALDSELSLSVGASRAQVEQAVDGHIVAETQLVARYKRK